MCRELKAVRTTGKKYEREMLKKNVNEDTTYYIHCWKRKVREGRASEGVEF